MSRSDNALAPLISRPARWIVQIADPEAVDLAKAEPQRVIFPAAFFQHVVAMAEGNVDLTHDHAVLAGVADDLRRRVKSHRLRIQQAAAKRVGMKMLEP